MRSAIASGAAARGEARREVAEAARLAEGATVDIEVENGAIRITPARPRLRLADLLQDETARGEYDCGLPKGEQVL